MRKPGVTTIAAAAMVAALAASGSAQAAPPPCAPISTTYESGGAPSASSPNDPLYAKQWGLQQIKAPGAWARGAFGAGATIAVVDTGVDLNHPDLQSRLVGGTDLVSEESCTPGAQDLNGHGTHVAGIAAAATGNGIGVAGVAPLANVMPVRVLDATGSGYTDDIGAGIRWAADHGAQVINLSLGDAIPLPLVDLSGISESVDYAWSKGANIVAAAGNEMLPFCEYPAAAAKSICVAATDASGFPSGYSNFGLRLDGGVAVRAPGGDGSGDCGPNADVWSTYWPGASGADAERCAPKGYEPLAGTSMATPFVSGVVAMLRGAGLSNAQAMDCLRQTSSNGGGYDLINGYGLVDAENAVAGCTQLAIGGPQLQPGGDAQGGTGGPGRGSTEPGTAQPGGGVEGERAQSDTTPPRIRLRIPARRGARIARHGRKRYVRIRVRLSERAKIVVEALSGRETAIAGRNAIVLARGTRRLRGHRTYRMRLRLTRKGRRVMRHHRSLTITLIALARDAAGNNGTAVKEGRFRR